MSHRAGAQFRDFYRDRSVLITGGLGFIGSNVAHTLAHLGALLVVQLAAF